MRTFYCYRRIRGLLRARGGVDQAVKMGGLHHPGGPDRFSGAVEPLWVIVFVPILGIVRFSDQHLGIGPHSWPAGTSLVRSGWHCRPCPSSSCTRLWPSFPIWPAGSSFRAGDSAQQKTLTDPACLANIFSHPGLCAFLSCVTVRDGRRRDACIPRYRRSVRTRQRYLKEFSWMTR